MPARPQAHVSYNTKRGGNECATKVVKGRGQADGKQAVFMGDVSGEEGEHACDNLFAGAKPGEGVSNVEDLDDEP